MPGFRTSLPPSAAARPAALRKWPWPACAFALLALLPGAVPVRAAVSGAQAGNAALTIYRCVDDHGRLALRDSPCAPGEQAEVLHMQRPADAALPPPAEDTGAVAIDTAAPQPPQAHAVALPPPQPMYECTTPEGGTYTSDSDAGNPRWVPLWTLGYPVLPRPPVRPPREPSGSRPPHPLQPPRPPRPPLAAAPVPVPAGGSWVRDACVRLPQGEVCRRLSDRRYEILRIYHAAMPSGRAELDREQAAIDARLGSDCRS